MSAVAAVRNIARSSAKVLVEGSLVGSGLCAVARARRRSDLLVLAYHNIVPEGQTATGDLSLHLPQRLFASQLEVLARTHDVVPLAEVLRPATGKRPRAVITFDDAYTGAVEAGVDELVARGMPATIFVTPAFLGGGTFWWDEIAEASLGCVPEGARSWCLRELGGRTPAVLAWADSAGMARNPIPAHQRAASLEALTRAAARPGISVAAHSWSHANLAALGGADLEEELERPLAWLRERFEQPLPWVTYPYGLHSPAVQEMSKRVGYAGAMRVDGGWLNAPASSAPRFALPRINIPAGLSTRGFELRVSGF